MSHDVTNTVRVRAGQLEIYNRPGFQTKLQHLEDGEYVLNIQPLKASRSAQQNRYYWKILEIIADHSGHTPLELHESMKIRFLAHPMVFQSRSGQVEELSVPVSTTNLDVPSFWDYTESIRQWAAEFLDVNTPSPSG